MQWIVPIVWSGTKYDPLTTTELLKETKGGTRKLPGQLENLHPKLPISPQERQRVQEALDAAMAEARIKRYNS